MSKRFTIKKIKQEKPITQAENKISEKDLAGLYDASQNNDFEHPITRSRVMAITLVVGVVCGFLAGLVGVIFFFSGSFSSLKISPEDLLPAQQFKIERYEQVNVLEDERLAKISQDANSSVVSIFKKKPISDNVLENIYLPAESRGAGFVLTSDGWIMTYAQAIENTDFKYVVVTNDKRILDVKKFVFDDYSGIVFLKVETDGLITLPLAGQFKLMPAERLICARNLADLKNESLVVRLEKEGWQDNSSRAKLVKRANQANNFLTFDQAIDEKYLGSPIINLAGEVVGILVGYNGRVLGRSIYDIKPAIAQVLEGKEKISRIVLGVRYLDLSSAVGSNIKVKKGERVVLLDKGVLLVEIIPGTAAAKAKLAKGDVIIKVGNKEVSVENSFERLLQEYKIGDSFNLTVLRPGEEEEKMITVNF